MTTLLPLQSLPANITQLSINYSPNLTSLDGLENLDQLTQLNLTGTGVQDLSLIAHLPNLEYVNIHETPLEDPKNRNPANCPPEGIAPFTKTLCAGRPLNSQ